VSGYASRELLGQGLELVGNGPVDLLARDVLGNRRAVVLGLHCGALDLGKLVATPPPGRAALAVLAGIAIVSRRATIVAASRLPPNAPLAFRACTDVALGTPAIVTLGTRTVSALRTPAVVTLRTRTVVTLRTRTVVTLRTPAVVTLRTPAVVTLRTPAVVTLGIPRALALLTGT
jgi:hypothetical protein